MKSTMLVILSSMIWAAVYATAIVERVRPTIPVFYLSEAGPKPVEEVKLPSFKSVKVCPENYPNGFTFRCDSVTGPTFPVVVFRIMGKVYMKERSFPYYLAGDTPVKVRPFPYGAFGPKDKIMGTRLRITCRVRTRKPVWIDVITDCEEPGVDAGDEDDTDMDGEGGEEDMEGEGGEEDMEGEGGEEDMEGEGGEEDMEGEGGEEDMEGEGGEEDMEGEGDEEDMEGEGDEEDKDGEDDKDTDTNGTEDDSEADKDGEGYGDEGADEED